MRLLNFLILFVVFIVALIFSVLNFHSVEINLYLTTISMPLIVALTVDFLIGLMIGVAFTFVYIVKLKAQYARLAKMLDKGAK